MTTLNSRRLVPIQNVAETREEEAARRLLECQQRLAEHETRLDDIRRYARDYSVAPGGATAALLVNRQAFIARLQEAERFQLKAVDDARLAVEAERVKWMLKRRDVSVLDQLAACYRASERRKEERHDQRGADELALRRFLAAQGEEH